MPRRRVRLAVGALLVALLALAGCWRRTELVTEQAAARARHVAEVRQVAHTRAEIRSIAGRAQRLESTSTALGSTANDLSSTAAGLATRIDQAQRQRDEAAVAAFYSGGKVAELRACLDGIERALNQVSVEDPGAAGALALVEVACRPFGT